MSAFDGTFAGFRELARKALADERAPGAVLFDDASDRQTMLFSGAVAPGTVVAPSSRVSVSARFLRDAERASLHRDPQRWSLIYRLLWRHTHGEPELFARAADPDVRALALLLAAIDRDIHKMHAFVRFRRARHDAGGRQTWVAFYEPDHRVAELAMPLFIDRFGNAELVVATPDVTLRWDTKRLHRESGMSSLGEVTARWPLADGEDDLSALFGTYYASTFNPARLNERMMRSEMPQRFWKNLPETQLIPRLVAEARGRTRAMVERGQTAEIAIGATLPMIGEAAQCCRVCPHAARATQAVSGRGPSDAAIVLIGEQPGEEEDWRGRPFVGPAGQLLRTLMAEAGMDVESVYLTNAVKHFTYTVDPAARGTRRLHQKPSYSSVRACQPLLLAELAAIKPKVIVCLGATAGQSLLGSGFRLAQARDKVVPQPWAEALIATYHPSAVLRRAGDDAGEARAQLVADLRRAVALARAETVVDIRKIA